ncbi:hypothetical protein [Bifidobacterium sp. ESL0745]|uniref:hypothetical protein n=1 Tax=Bifidobacterium sp. ESL0745 TaxID=2983226 RepID=UPI0023FA3A29|nr:hypothetical protein [Bifidobacterium sp. ESL0745]MDF7665707.1 hypothetical protein [Bifidobacterium sp. ESL0745]
MIIRMGNHRSHERRIHGIGVTAEAGEVRVRVDGYLFRHTPEDAEVVAAQMEDIARELRKAGRMARHQQAEWLRDMAAVIDEGGNRR